MLRKTFQMQLIREVIEEEGRPLSAKEMLDAGKIRLPSLSLATVYRAISLLLQEGFLVEVFLPGGAKRFEKQNLTHHHFFHCFTCDRAFGIGGCPGNFPYMTPKGFEVVGHEVILYGKCALCQ